MHKIMNKVCDALEDIEKSENWSIMSPADRKALAELVDLKKNLLKVEKLEEEMDGGYSMTAGGSAGMSGDMSGNYSGRARHFVRGHYSRNNYSRDGAMGEMMGCVEAAMEAAPDERSRKMILEFKEKLERMG